MKRFHVVRIYTDGYTLVASYADREAAKQNVLRASRSTSSVVMRDGNTGKRFSVAELSAEAA